MRTASYQTDIVHGMAAELDIDLPKIEHRHLRAWVKFINRFVREAWELPWPLWPELNLTEERAFREVWDAGIQYAVAGWQGDPDEIYYVPNATYYRVKAAAPSDPPIGTLPTNATYFEALPLPVRTAMAADIRGKQSIGMVQGAFASDPGAGRARRWQTGLSEFGIELPAGAGPTVWLSYRVLPSKFTSERWDATVAYKRNSLIYDAESGECFRALSDHTNQPPATTPGIWRYQPMPLVLSEYVKLAAASQASDDAARRADLKGQADDALAREIDKLVVQGVRYPRHRAFGGSGARGYRPIATVPIAVPVI